MLPIFSSRVIKEWDQYTIKHEPVSSLELMDRAGRACAEYLQTIVERSDHIAIICGNGNNGGDGLVIAGVLIQAGYQVQIGYWNLSDTGSLEFNENLNRLKNAGIENIKQLDLNDADEFLADASLIIDAILGSGLNREMDLELQNFFKLINSSGIPIISIDMPSGTYADKANEGEAIRADLCLCLQAPKLSQLVSKTAQLSGQIHIIDIGLADSFLPNRAADYYLTEAEDIQHLFRPRNKFDYKNTFGHTLIIGGDKGMAGAVYFAAAASLRCGVGLCTISSIEAHRMVLQSIIPEAMFQSLEQIDNLNLKKFKSIGIGPGMGNHPILPKILSELISNYSGIVVLDADALNHLAHSGGTSSLQGRMIITPHIGEFDRLFGVFKDDFARLNKAKEIVAKHSCTIVLKGPHTAIISPDSAVYFNNSGNPGLAKAGSGDVLCGMICSFLAQGYSVQNACLLAVYLHGLSADLLADHLPEESMMASDIINNIPEAIKTIYS